MNERVLVDTGFWIALYDTREEHHRATVETADLIDLLHVVMPWPTVYETLRTRFVRHPEWVASFDARLKKPRVTFIDDRDYCEEAYSLTVDSSIRDRRDISMVDMVCRLILNDPTMRINYLFTVNPRDFHDVCANTGVEILPRPGG